MRNKKWISLAVAVVLTVTALPATVFAAKDGESKEELTKVTLNEVAHSIFYAPQYAAIELGYFKDEGIDLTLVNGAGADKVMTAVVSSSEASAAPSSVADITIRRKSGRKARWLSRHSASPRSACRLRS